MAQSCDGFSKISLMGNWYEERLAPEQNQRGQNPTKTLRDVEEGISIPGDQGKILPLPRVARNPPWITKDLIPDDGFREFRSLQNTTQDPLNIKNMQALKDCRSIIKTNGQRVMFPESNSTVAQTGGVQNYNMLQQVNMHQVERVRDVTNNITDFGSTFKAHPETHNKFHGVTTYQQHFQNIQGLTVKDILAESKQKGKVQAAGTNERDEKNQGFCMTSVLIGEKFRNQPDPKENTSVQRAWLPSTDPGLVSANNNLQTNDMMNTQTHSKPFHQLQTYKQNNSQTLPYDIATSLPLADGTYALQRKYNNPGEYRHVRTDVTIIRNKPLTKK